MLPEEASFCPCCTASQMERRPVVAPPPNGGRKRRRVWLCAALALLLAGVGIWALTGGRAVGYDPPVPDPQQPDSLEGTLKQDTGQVWYDGADGTLYHVFACFSPQPDGGGVPASHRKELLLRGEESSSPLCLFVVKADDREEDVRAAFRHWWSAIPFRLWHRRATPAWWTQPQTTTPTPGRCTPTSTMSPANAPITTLSGRCI